MTVCARAEQVGADEVLAHLLVRVTGPADVLKDELRDHLLEDVIEEEKSRLTLDVKPHLAAVDITVVEVLRRQCVVLLGHCKTLEDFVPQVILEHFARRWIQFSEDESQVPLDLPELEQRLLHIAAEEAAVV